MLVGLGSGLMLVLVGLCFQAYSNPVLSATLLGLLALCR